MSALSYVISLGGTRSAVGARGRSKTARTSGLCENWTPSCGTTRPQGPFGDRSWTCEVDPQIVEWLTCEVGEENQEWDQINEPPHGKIPMAYAGIVGLEEDWINPEEPGGNELFACPATGKEHRRQHEQVVHPR